ncbi:MAG: SsrA-binding protein [Candidatus Kerfeldbacteria bacterium]|nr:SsrA-binding protein [Candidatus Kerfeldbacteria bacterium]
MPTYARYKTANSSYDVLDRLEAGIVLSGPEVKSVKAGSVNLLGSYIRLTDHRLEVREMHIGPYLPAKGEQKSYDPKHPRLLLISRQQRNSLIGKLHHKSLTMIPLSVYSKSGLVKVEIALVRKKSHEDRRELLKKKAVDRDLARELKYRK